MTTESPIITIGDIPDEYLLKMRGREKPYILHQGLLSMAHQHGLASIETKLVSTISVVYDGAESDRYLIRAKVKGTRGSYSGYGDADVGNVASGFGGAVLRIAETRAVNRALRFYLGVGICSVDELGPDGPSTGVSLSRNSGRDMSSQPNSPKPQGNIQNAAPLGRLPPCPHCGGRVWDNRDARAKGENRRPAVSCMNRDGCYGHKQSKKQPNGDWKSKYVPWIQWEYNPDEWTASPNAPHSTPAPGYTRHDDATTSLASTSLEPAAEEQDAESLSSNPGEDEAIAQAIDAAPEEIPF